MSIEQEIERIVLEHTEQLRIRTDLYDSELHELRNELRTMRDDLGKLRNKVTPAVLQASEDSGVGTLVTEENLARMQVGLDRALGDPMVDCFLNGQRLPSPAEVTLVVGDRTIMERRPPRGPDTIIGVPAKALAWAVEMLEAHLDTKDLTHIDALKRVLPQAGTCPTCLMPYHPSSHTEDEPCPRA